MKMNEMIKSKWYKIRLNSKAKTFAICKTSFLTKTTASRSIKSGNFKPLTYSHSVNMIADGWVECIKPKAAKETVKTASIEVIELQKTIMEEEPKLVTKVVSKANRSQWERLQDFISRFKVGKCELTDCEKYGLNLIDVMNQIRPQKDSVAINKSKIIRTKHPQVRRKRKSADTNFLKIFDDGNHISALND